MFDKSLHTKYDVDIANLIVSFRKGNSWEQIAGDSIKQWNVMRQKLGFIYILYGAQELSNKIIGKRKTPKLDV